MGGGGSPYSVPFDPNAMPGQGSYNGTAQGVGQFGGDLASAALYASGQLNQIPSVYGNAGGNANGGSQTGYPGVDQRNQFIQGNNAVPGSDAQIFPYYNGLSGTTTGVPYAGASLAGFNQTNQGQQTALTDALAGGSQSLGDQYYQDALNNLSSLSMPDQATLQQEANQQAGLKYDPLIQQLQNSLSSAQTNEQAASGKIGNMYDALGRALAAQMPNITNQYATSEAQSQNQYQQLQNQINTNYQGAKDAQAAELQKLGIQAALPQSTQKLNSDQQYLGNQAGVNGQALQDAMKLMGQGQADWTQRASNIAPMQGANIQANLATQLMNLQNQVNQQIAGYKGQESAAAAALLTQLTNAAQKNYNAQQTQSLNQSYKLAQMMNLTHPGAFGIKPKAPTATKYRGASGVSNYFADNAATADPNQMQSDYSGFVGSPAYANLTGPSGSGVPTLETSYQGLQQYLQQNDPNALTNPQALAELYNALAIKYKQY
jgi:hypothetical protein